MIFKPLVVKTHDHIRYLINLSTFVAFRVCTRFFDWRLQILFQTFQHLFCSRFFQENVIVHVFRIQRKPIIDKSLNIEIVDVVARQTALVSRRVIGHRACEIKPKSRFLLPSFPYPILSRLLNDKKRHFQRKRVSCVLFSEASQKNFFTDND